MKRVITIVGALLIAVVSAFIPCHNTYAWVEPANYNPNNPYVFIDKLGNMHRVDYLDKNQHDFYDARRNEFEDGYKTVVAKSSEDFIFNFKYASANENDFHLFFEDKTSSWPTYKYTENVLCSHFATKYNILFSVYLNQRLNDNQVVITLPKSVLTDLGFELSNIGANMYIDKLITDSGKPLTFTYPVSTPNVIEGRAQNAYITYEEYVQEQRDLSQGYYWIGIEEALFLYNPNAQVVDALSFDSLTNDVYADKYNYGNPFPGRVRVDMSLNFYNYYDLMGAECLAFGSRIGGTTEWEYCYLPHLTSDFERVTFVSTREDVVTIAWIQPDIEVSGSYYNIVVSNFYTGSTLVAYDEGYGSGLSDGTDVGYNQGYTQGYGVGMDAGSTSNITTSWFTNIVRQSFYVLGVELFPGFYLGYVVGVAILLPTAMFIIRLLKR